MFNPKDAMPVSDKPTFSDTHVLVCPDCKSECVVSLVSKDASVNWCACGLVFVEACHDTICHDTIYVYNFSFNGEGK